MNEPVLSMNREQLLACIFVGFGAGQTPSLPSECKTSPDCLEETSGLWSKSWDDINLSQFDEKTWLYTSVPPKYIAPFLGCYMHKSIYFGQFDHRSFDSLLEGGDHLSKYKKYATPNLSILRISLSSRQLLIFREYILYRAEKVGMTERSSLLAMAKALSSSI